MLQYSVLIPVALPSSGPELLRVARLLAAPSDLLVTALHCWTEEEHRGEDLGNDHGGTAESPLEPLLLASGDVRVDPMSFTSADVEEDILSIARKQKADLILMGWHRPMVHDDEEPGPIRGVLERAGCDVAVYLARQCRPFRRVLVPFHGGKHDRRALELADRFSRRTGVDVTVLHVVSSDRPARTGWSDAVEEISDGRVRLKVVESEEPVEAAVREAWTGYDLIVAGASEVWGVDFSFFSERLQQLAFATPASLLVVRSGGPEPSSSISGGTREEDRGRLVDSDA